MNITTSEKVLAPGDTTTICVEDVPDTEETLIVTVDLAPPVEPTPQQLELLGPADETGKRCATWTAPPGFTGATFSYPGAGEVRVSGA